MTIIDIQDLHFRYPSGVSALNGVDLEIARGERVAVIGQNGAGKTTLARHLNGIYQPGRGRITIAGEDAAGKSIARLAAKVGYVFQNPSEQLFAKTVRADVEFGPRNLGADEAQAVRLTEWALEVTGLTEQADHHPYHLSPAERKRVALASVLAMDTPVIVLDEPTTGQDHDAVRRIVEIIAELHGRGTTVIAISHDMDFCAEHFDRVVAMAQGRVIADGTPAQVFGRPDKLAEAAVEPPQTMRLATELGWDGATATTVPEFLDELRARRAAG
ncbi:energy-coupling factor transport system ATP-binding protein [Spinactinospora alkalitolerans]|uniref:Energy-coupling factor transport system ATP-binding protein n=1 Tax=Spinactinospora alkalitolerans TaxID=687207 RepID=A0A852TSD7_9ACTN|nr:ABC transporter ATP-binding protein [Spinactinospora alkalitolerans]NYE47316.1 energy-coupling factor transport system ATP-binding protein [Spinactinospora alkalitolerans]